MIKRTAMAVLAGGAMLATSSTATAQFSGAGPLPRDGACFYQDINYRGQYFCAEAEDLNSLPSGANDRVSSIRIFGRAAVRVYEDPRFRGESLTFEAISETLKAKVGTT